MKDEFKECVCGCGRLVPADHQRHVYYEPECGQKIRKERDQERKDSFRKDVMCMFILDKSYNAW